jgi:hypothetical protein
MKIALKHGLLITAVVFAWVMVVHFAPDFTADSRTKIIPPVLFNLTTLLAIFFGMKARKKQLNGALGFKEGIKTGMAISLVYGFSSCVFFMLEYLVAGPKLLLSVAGSESGPLWQIAVFHYAGMFFGALFFGLIFSTLIAFFLARRQGRESTEII